MNIDLINQIDNLTDQLLNEDKLQIIFNLIIDIKKDGYLTDYEIVEKVFEWINRINNFK